MISMSLFKTPDRPERKRGIVANFSTFSDETLEMMKKDLSLSMLAPELRHLRNHYAKFEHTFPTLDEIYFFDALAQAHHSSESFLSVSKFETADRDLAETFDDLLKKLRALERPKKKGDASLPPSLTALSPLLTAYLERCGKKPSPVDRHVCAVYQSETLLEAIACGAVDHGRMLHPDSQLPSPHILSVLSSEQSLRLLRGAGENDAIMLLSDPDGCLGEKLPLLTADPSYSPVSSVKAIDRHGILSTISKMVTKQRLLGAFIDIEKLPGVSDGGELTDLVTEHHGDLLVSLPQENCAALSLAAEEYGIYAVQIARAVLGGRFTVRRRSASPISFSVLAVANFASVHAPFRFEIGETDALSPSSFVESSQKTGDTSYFLAGCEEHGFHRAMSATLLSLFRVLLSGGVREEILLSLSIVLPDEFTGESIGKVISTLLGVYRAAAEFSIPLSVSYSDDPSLLGFTVTAAANCKEKDPFLDPSFLPKNLSLTPLFPYPKCESGLPDFTALRSLFHKAETLLHENRSLLSDYLRSIVKIPEENCEETNAEETGFADLPADGDRLARPTEESEKSTTASEKSTEICENPEKT